MKQKDNTVDNQPLSNLKWRDRDKLKPNDYNPNQVAPNELKLLKISIKESGWTQPIVINKKNEIVDGYHRWLVSGDDDINKLTNGLVPTVRITESDYETQKMATIRHNRARGTHTVLNMASIVLSLVDKGLSKEEIMERLQMEDEEVVRLTLREGVPLTDKVTKTEWSKSWVPDNL